MSGALGKRLVFALLAGFGGGAAALALALPPSEHDVSLVEKVRRKAPVARCVGVEESSCRLRSYCTWYRGYRRPDGSRVEAYCHFRPWHRARERATWKD